MIDIVQLIATATTTLNELSEQAAILGTGLQNAAPGNKTGTPNNAVQYLLDTSASLSKISKECEGLSSVSQHSQQPGIRN
ncbi:MAG TPA: hypothetical protein VJN02_01045 [Gammaproteobacteria bacterium]|nr:hypothetical protein [Gammaproteobacteria bacterium]